MTSIGVLMGEAGNFKDAVVGVWGPGGYIVCTRVEIIAILHVDNDIRSVSIFPIFGVY